MDAALIRCVLPTLLSEHTTTSLFFYLSVESNTVLLVCPTRRHLHSLLLNNICHLCWSSSCDCTYLKIRKFNNFYSQFNFLNHLRKCQNHWSPTWFPSTRTLCFLSWHEGKWHDCSTSCGEGVQERNVYCQALQQGDINSIVEEDFCGAAPRPISLQPCNMDVACPDWVTSPWSTVRTTRSPIQRSQGRLTLEGALEEFLWNV